MVSGSNMNVAVVIHALSTNSDNIADPRNQPKTLFAYQYVGSYARLLL
jgi:hypothetical protein